MATSSLLDLTPLRPPATSDRLRLLQVAEQRLSAMQRGQLHSRYGPSSIQLQYRVWTLQHGQQAPQKLSSLAAVQQFYAQQEGRLLILGESGSGKSQTLYELGAKLCYAAQRDATQPVPVLLELTELPGKELRPWLLAQLWQHYRIPRPWAQRWIDGSQLLLLLDGFEQLPGPAQRSWSLALDALMRRQSAQGVVLCCQRQTLERSGINFSYFNGGIQLLPLVAQQVKDYTTHLKAPRLWQAIKASKALQQLARSPLLLNLLASSLDGFPARNRQELVAQFIQAQLVPTEGAKWLGEQLAREPMLYPDALSTDWLTGSQGWLYRLLLGLILGGIAFGISGSLVVGLALGLMGCQVDVERFPYYHLSWAARPLGAWGLPLLTAGLLGLLLGIGVGGGAGPVMERLGQPGGGIAAASCTLGFGGGLLVQMRGGLRSLQVRQQPGQDVAISLRNGLMVAVVYGLVLAVSLTLAGAEMSGAGLRQLVAFPLVVLLWSTYGVQCSLLRLLLSRQLTPLRSSALVAQVGGGYRFIHEQVRQYFAP